MSREEEEKSSLDESEVLEEEPRGVLEEKFQMLRDKGLSDKKILRIIFKEDPNANIEKLCELTGLNKLEIGRIKGQVMRWRDKIPPPPSPVEMPQPERISNPREYVALYGEAGLERLKRSRLIDFLQAAPGVGKRTVAWVIKQWDIDETVRKDPNALHALLKSSGVSDAIAIRICNALMALESSLQDVLRAPTTIFYTPPRQQGIQPIFPTPQTATGYPYYPSVGYPQRSQYPQQGYYGYTPYPPATYPPPAKKDELDIDKLAEKVAEKLKPPPREERREVTITEPLRDAEGKIMRDENGKIIYRMITASPSQLGILSSGDPEMLFLKKAEKYKNIFAPEKSPKEEESHAVKMLQSQLDEMSKKYEKLKDKMEEKERKRLEETILSMKEELKQLRAETSGGKVVEGYRSDAYRFLGQGLKEVAQVAREKQPVKVIVDFLREGSAPSKEIEEGAREGIIGRLPKEYVSEE